MKRYLWLLMLALAIPAFAAPPNRAIRQDSF
ncbi:MAG: hypothetical protein KatS3mg022_2427 [Armatimonadota bacterium]|nr:MAG: hypothetical protein KatS3mg022_2427 [Armatimonadota bacterium]